MRIAIVGCRPPKRYCSQEVFWWTSRGEPVPSECETYERILLEVHILVSNLSEQPGTVIVSGRAAGVDLKAAEAGRRFGLEVVEYRPDYSRYAGHVAPLERNTVIVKDSDYLHAFPAPWSRGSWDTLRKAARLGLPHEVHKTAWPKTY